MSATDTQARKAVEHAVIDHPGEEIGRLERVADDVAQIAAATEGRILDNVVGAARMHEDQRSEVGRLFPERVELRKRGVLAVDVSANGCSTQAQSLDAVLQLFRRQVRVLERDGRERDKAIR